MKNSPLVPGNSRSIEQQAAIADGLQFPPRQKSAPVICLSEHEVDIAQDLVAFVQMAVSWRSDEQGPSASTLEKIEYLFDVAATLYGAGAPPRLVAEAVLHPVVSGEGVVTSPQQRREQLNDYLNTRFRERPFLAVENRLSQVPAGSISYELPASLLAGDRTWSEIKQQILAPTLEALTSAPGFAPHYSDDQLAFIREGVRIAVQPLSPQNLGRGSTVSADPDPWDTLHHRLDIGLLLLSTRRPPEVVVAGLLHDLKEKCSDEAWPDERHRIELFFGSRVRELVELIGVHPAAWLHHDTANITVSQEPLLLSRFNNYGDELGPDLEPIIAAKSVSILARDLMETLAFARAVSIPMRRVPDVFATGLKDWGELKWTENIAVFSSYCDYIYADKHFRPVFDRTIRTWAKAPKFLPGTIALMTARKAFEELFPRLHESSRARLDSMNLVRQVMRSALGAAAHATATSYLLASYEKHTGNLDRLKEVQANMVNFEEGLFADESRTPQVTMEMAPVQHTVLERELMVRAVDYIADFFCRENLRDMVRDPVDQMKHSCEVGFVLMRTGVKADVIIAGLLHDVYELTPIDELPKIRQEVKERFGDLGERVDALIDIVTEPPKDPVAPRENYIIRKSKVIRDLDALNRVDSDLARDAASVVCAAKISTMKDGYHFASDFAKVQPWTKGSWSENVRAMCGLHDMFETFGIFPQLLGAYREELRGWIEVTRYMLPSLLDNSVRSESFKDAAKRHVTDSDIEALLSTVVGFHRTFIGHEGNDIRLLLSQAVAVTSRLPAYAIPVDAQNTTNFEVAALLNEVGRQVFLPRGLYLFSRILGEWCEIVSGVVADTKRDTFSYLGKAIEIFDVRFEHGLNNLTDVSATIDGRILIDQALSALHGRRIIEKLESHARAGDGIAIRLIEALIKHRISPENFERIQGYDRHLFQQLACAEDTRYLELLAGPGNFRFNDSRFANDLLKGNDCISWMFQFGPQLANVLVRQYSAALGGLNKQLQHYLSTGDSVSAKVCFLSAWLHFRDAVFQSTSSSMAVVKRPPAALFLRKMNDILTPPFLDTDMFTSEDWKSDVQKVVNAVHEAYNEEFYNHNERVENLVFIDSAQGRPSHPAVLAERNRINVH